MVSILEAVEASGRVAENSLPFGSDWPVCLLSGEYAEVVGIIDDFISTLTPAEQSLIWADTACRVYRIR